MQLTRRCMELGKLGNWGKRLSEQDIVIARVDSQFQLITASHGGQAWTPCGRGWRKRSDFLIAGDLDVPVHVIVVIVQRQLPNLVNHSARQLANKSRDIGVRWTLRLRRNCGGAHHVAVVDFWSLDDWVPRRRH